MTVTQQTDREKLSIDHDTSRRLTTDAASICAECGASLATHGRLTVEDADHNVRVVCAPCASDMSVEGVGVGDTTDATDDVETPTTRLYLRREAWPMVVRLLDTLKREMRADDFDEFDESDVIELLGRIDPESTHYLTVDAVDVSILTSVVVSYRVAWHRQGFDLDPELVDLLERRTNLADYELDLFGCDAEVDL